MFVKINTQKDSFIYVNINHIIHIEPHSNGIGSTVKLSNSTSFYSEQPCDDILANIGETMKLRF